MLIAQMPVQIAEGVRELLARSPEVWLFGSRVNPSDTPPRDWDVLVFGDLDLLSEFQERAPVEHLDLFIVWNDDNFQSPWISYPEGPLRSGSLSGWRWHKTREGEAKYRGFNIRQDGGVEATWYRAVRLWPERSGA
jgi:hypothetical protein